MVSKVATTMQRNFNLRRTEKKKEGKKERKKKITFYYLLFRGILTENRNARYRQIDRPFC